MSTRAPLAACQKRLAVLWIAASAVLFAVIIIQSLTRKYGDATEDVWKWFLPTVVPTLTLIIGAIAATAQQPGGQATVLVFPFRVSFGLSAFYLAAVALVVLIEPLASQATALGLMEQSTIWLSAIQGLVGLSLGAFFASRGSE